MGWPDTEAEWRVIHEAALVFGVRQGGELVGQGALGLYEGAGSIAKMVVLPSVRRQGIGAKILDRILGEAERRGLSALGLVATPLGRPLYESRGFVPVGDVVITMGTAQLTELSSTLSQASDAEPLLAIERRFMAGSRTNMLCGRLREACASALAPDGFALATAHDTGARIGPIVADGEETARLLASTLFQRLNGPVRLDVPGGQSAFRDWLLSLGLVEKGVHVEMARGGTLPWHVPERFCLATQAWG